METRMERDSIGSLRIPEDAYYGIHSMRAAENFDITRHKLNPDLIVSLAQIKKAAAITNRDAGKLNPSVASAVLRACDEVIAGRLHDNFIVDPVQGGAGTSANMNANEVIANKALEILGRQKGDYSYIHPNDHVNMSQSTNDVFPTAGKLAALRMIPRAVRQLERLQKSLAKKSVEFQGIIKMGRTQLQDAVPISLGQSFHAYCSMVKRDIRRLTRVQQELRTVNLGGTAIGTAINVSPYYFQHITENLSAVTGFPLRRAGDLIDATQNLDCFLVVSGIIKACAVDLSKMCNDFRLLSSGPKTGLGEISLPARQNGSSIMPGKINPVIPEVVTQVAFSIIGNDQTVTLAAEAGQLELNAFEPVLFYKLFESVESLERAAATLVDHCVDGITPNRSRCDELLKRSIGIVTALCPYIGYEKAADIAKTSLATGKSIENLVIESHLLPWDKANKILNPARLISPAI